MTTPEHALRSAFCDGDLDGEIGPEKMSKVPGSKDVERASIKTTLNIPIPALVVGVIALLVLPLLTYFLGMESSKKAVSTSPKPIDDPTGLSVAWKRYYRLEQAGPGSQSDNPEYHIQLKVARELLQIAGTVYAQHGYFMTEWGRTEWHGEKCQHFVALATEALDTADRSRMPISQP